MAIKLKITSLREEKTSELKLEQTLITAGRSKACSVELASPDVSRRHFLVKFIDDQYVLLDEGSRFGTKLDGQSIEALKIYPLSSKHIIEVPGFVIELTTNGIKPQQENTTIVARKLLDEILEGKSSEGYLAQLEDAQDKYHFQFKDDQSSFVLGSLEEKDFVVDEEGVAFEHVSFVRDISGVKLIPIASNLVEVDGQVVSEPVMLNHGAQLKIANLAFLFKEHHDEELSKNFRKKNAPTKKSEEKESPIADPTLPGSANQKNYPEKSQKSLSGLDAVLLAGFTLACIGASVVIYFLI